MVEVNIQNTVMFSMFCKTLIIGTFAAFSILHP